MTALRNLEDLVQLAAEHGRRDLVQWLLQEKDFPAHLELRRLRQAFHLRRACVLAPSLPKCALAAYLVSETDKMRTIAARHADHSAPPAKLTSLQSELWLGEQQLSVPGERTLIRLIDKNILPLSVTRPAALPQTIASITITEEPKP